jgi:hypothetical protein
MGKRHWTTFLCDRCQYEEIATANVTRPSGWLMLTEHRLALPHERLLCKECADEYEAWLSPLLEGPRALSKAEFEHALQSLPQK